MTSPLFIIPLLLYVIGNFLSTCCDGRSTTIAFIGQAGHGIKGVMNSIAARFKVSSNNNYPCLYPTYHRFFYESKHISSHSHRSRAAHKTLLTCQHQNSVLFGVSGYMTESSTHLVSSVREDVAYLTKEGKGSVKGIILVVNSQAPRGVAREIQTIAGIFVKTFGVRMETSFRILCTKAPFGHMDACRSISNQVRQSLQSRLGLNITDIPFWTIENHPEDLTQLMISSEDIDDEVKRKSRTLDEIMNWFYDLNTSHEEEEEEERLKHHHHHHHHEAAIENVGVNTSNTSTATSSSMEGSFIQIEADPSIDPLVVSLLLVILFPFYFFTFCNSNTRKVVSYALQSTVEMTITTDDDDDVYALKVTTGQAIVATNEGANEAVAYEAQPNISDDECLKKNSSSYTTEVDSNPVACGDSSQDDGTILPSFQPILSPTVDSGHAITNNNTLHVLLSSPLVITDDTMPLTALPGFDVDNEIAVFKQVGIEVNRDISIHFDIATVDTLSTLLSHGCCNALHFSGHGTTGGLCFEDALCRLHIITAEDLIVLLDKIGGVKSLQFVFLSSCYSQEIGQVFINAGVHYCVCVKKDVEIQDGASIVFTRALYLSLFSGKSVPASFEDAKATLKQSRQIYEREKEASKFILLHRTSSERRQDEAPPPLLFMGDRLADDSWPVLGMKHCVVGTRELDIHTYDEAKNKLPTLSSGDYFIGREVIVYEVIQLLLLRESRSRLVTLYGERGVGKSSVAAAVCRKVLDRGVEMIEDIIIYYDARTIIGGYTSFCNDLQDKVSTIHSAAGLMITAVLSKQSNGPLPFRALLVLDNMPRSVIATADFRSMLKLLLDTCPHLKVLVTSEHKLINNRFISIEGVVEYPYLIGPLSLYSAIELFSKTAPILLHSPSLRRSFIRAFQPIISYTDPNSQLYSEALIRFGHGIPSYVIQMAGESTSEEVDALKRWAEAMYASPH